MLPAAVKPLPHRPAPSLLENQGPGASGVMKHSPQIALINARRELEFAREACPHWDCETDGAHSDCCYRVDDAKHAVRAARKAVEANQ